MKPLTAHEILPPSAKQCSAAATQVALRLEGYADAPPRPTPEEVMGVVDLNAKIEAFLFVAAVAWFSSDHHDEYHQRRFAGAHKITLESWDEDTVEVCFYPKHVSAYDYREFEYIPMRDLLPDFTEKQDFLRALQAGTTAVNS